jgi:hypothetical protein
VSEPDLRICIWPRCGNAIEHSFDIPLCVEHLVLIHHTTTDAKFDMNKPVQEYLAANIGKHRPVPKEGEPQKSEEDRIIEEVGDIQEAFARVLRPQITKTSERIREAVIECVLSLKPFTKKRRSKQ